MCQIRDKAASRHFSQLRDENRKLLGERERLRQLLEDREEDVKALREELARGRLQRKKESDGVRQTQEVGEMVGRLETLQSKYIRMRQDLQVAQETRFKIFMLKTIMFPSLSSMKKKTLCKRGIPISARFIV